MILIDSRVGSKELLPFIQRERIPCELTQLAYGDAAFSGNGPHGSIDIGIERKTLSDLLLCIEDARFTTNQLGGLTQSYGRVFMCLEGLWEAGIGGHVNGLLFQGFQKGASWGPFRPRGGRTVLYSKLYRYLLSLSLNGVIITQSGTMEHTAYNICEIYKYFQKPWEAHRSLAELPKMHLPTLNGKPSLVRRWAAELPGIGTQLSEDAAALFKTPIQLARAGEREWMRLAGVGAKTAIKIVKEIQGWKG